MADTEVNIEMRKRNPTNDGWIIRYPRTKAANVKTAGGSDVETALAESVQQLEKIKYRMYMGV